MGTAMDGQNTWDRHRLGSRKDSRAPIRLLVQARNGQNRREAQALDLSESGVRLRTLSQLRVGTAHWLKLGNLEALEVTVMWVDGFYAGCRFTKPIHPAVFQTLLSSLGPGY